MAFLKLRRGYWQIGVKVGGSNRYRSTGCKPDQRAKAEVIFEAFELEAKLERIDPTVKYRKIPIEQNLTDYSEWLLATNATPKHVEESLYKVRRIIKEAGIKKLADINAELVARTIAKMPSGQIIGKGKTPRPVGPGTRNKYRKAIRAFCNWMYKNQRTDRHLLINLAMENEAVDIRKRRTKLTDEEFTKLYRAAKESTVEIEGFTGEERAAIYYLAVATGLRKGELASLTRQSFTLKGKQMVLTVEANHTKSGRLDVLPIPDWATEHLQTWLAGFATDMPLFPNLKQRKTEELIRRDLKAAGVPFKLPSGETRDFHALRHTFISRCFASGAPALIVMAQARHSDLRTTQGYGHSTGGELKAAANALPKLKT